jgi:para-nitrobenzyl esterase
LESVMRWRIISYAAVVSASAGFSILAYGLAADVKMTEEIRGIEWQWISLTTPVEQVDVDSPERYTAQFGSEGRLALRADCNRGNGPYSITSDRQIKIGPFALTRAMCPPSSLGDRFVTDISRANSFFLRDGELYIELPVDSGTLHFRRGR